MQDVLDTVLTTNQMLLTMSVQCSNVHVLTIQTVVVGHLKYLGECSYTVVTAPQSVTMRANTPSKSQVKVLK